MVNLAENSEILKNLEFRNDIYQWAVSWFFRKKDQDTSKKPDIPLVISLLQIIGFKLEHFDKLDETALNEEKAQKDDIRITLECGTSKMAAVLKMKQVTCSCLDNQKIKDGSFWSVTGTGPLGVDENMVDETGSDLLPVVPKEKSQVLRDVLYRVFDLINGPTVENKSNLKSTLNLQASEITPKKTGSPASPLVRSYTDINDSNYLPSTVSNLRPNFESLKLSDSKSMMDISDIKTPKMRRERTFEKKDNSFGEPRPTLKKAPSPMELDFPDLDMSFDQLSMHVDDSVCGTQENLTKAVIKAHQILDRVITELNLKEPSSKLPLSSSLLSIIDDNDNFVKPLPFMSSSFCTQAKSRHSLPSAKVVRAPTSKINRSISNNLLSRSLANTSIPKSTALNRSTSSFIPTLATKTRTGLAPAVTTASKFVRPSRITTPSSRIGVSKLATMRETSQSPAKTSKPIKTTSAISTTLKKTSRTPVSTPLSSRASSSTLMSRSMLGKTNATKPNAKTITSRLSASKLSNVSLK